MKSPISTPTSTQSGRAVGRMIAEPIRAGRVIGYARVSTADQDTQLQLDALARAGCDNIAEEHGVSGMVSGENRPTLGKLLSWLEPGDTLVVWRLDRLGRSMIDLNNIVAGLEKRGVHFKSLCDPIDTSSAVGVLIFQLLASVANFERNLIAERTRAGLTALKEAGVKLGPPRKLDDLQVETARHWIANGGCMKTIAARMVYTKKDGTVKKGVSYHTLWRAIKRYEIEHGLVSNLPVPETRESEKDDAPTIEELRDKVANLGQPTRDQLIDHLVATAKPALPKHASIGDEGEWTEEDRVRIENETTPTRNARTGHANWCECDDCLPLMPAVADENFVQEDE